MSPAARRIGKYELLSKIGSGGVADVYLARQPDVGRDVVLKKLGLTLTSERVDGERIYRVTAGGPTRSKSNSCISTPPVA